MMEKQENDDENSLLFMYPQLQKLILSGVDKTNFPYTKTQFIILTILQKHPKLCMSQIAEYISSSNEQATRAVSPLADEGLVERFTEKTNRKLVHVRLTEAGKRYVDYMRKERATALEKRLKKSLTPEEIAQLNEAICTASALLDKLE